MKYKKTKALVTELFKSDDGKPLVLTDTQAEIFNLIWLKQHPRCHLMCHTRFGKSFVVALALLLRASTYPEKWAIIAPSNAKAKIIMGYIIQHAFDNKYFKNKLDFDKDESLERLRRERSKNRINFKHSDGTLGEIFILSADSRNKSTAGDSLMGFGAPNVVLDEAALIDNDIEAKIFRMLGDQMDNFYLKIGNPFRRNHFLKDYQNSKYYKVNADWEVGLREGRLTEEFLDEARKKPHFGVLYNNSFPQADAVDDKGWSFLVTDREYEYALDTIEEKSYIGVKTLGVDIARGGGNSNVWVMRCGNYAKVLAKNQDPDLMSVVGTIIRIAREHNIEPQNVFTDDTGVGAGVGDRLREQGFYINPVKLANKATEETKYVNRRAENYWKTKQWLNSGGKLCETDQWEEIVDIKYKAGSNGKLQIMPKDVMRRDGMESPDTADALMLTFDRAPFNKQLYEIEKKAEDEDITNRYDLF